jgi:hypothetical protein
MRTPPAKPLFRLGTVVQAVPVARAGVIAATLAALATLAVTLVLARDPSSAVAAVLITAAGWSIGMILISRFVSVPPPLPVSTDELPPEASLWSAVLPTAAIFVAVGAAAVIYSVWAHGYYVVGIVVGAPVWAAAALRRLKRRQRELRGVLWTAAGFTWSAYGRVTYLSPEQPSGEDGASPLAA